VVGCGGDPPPGRARQADPRIPRSPATMGKRPGNAAHGFYPRVRDARAPRSDVALTSEG